MHDAWIRTLTDAVMHGHRLTTIMHPCKDHVSSSREDSHMYDLFAKLLHVLVTAGYDGPGTLTLHAVGDVARLFIYGG
jgi:hypothetical protein